MLPIKHARSNFCKNDKQHSEMTIFEIQELDSLISNGKEFIIPDYFRKFYSLLPVHLPSNYSSSIYIIL